MSALAIAAIGLPILSGLLGNRSANHAADAQTAAANASIAEQQREFDMLRRDMSPYMQAGNSALSQQMALLGLAAPPQLTAADRQQYAARQQAAEMLGLDAPPPLTDVDPQQYAADQQAAAIAQIENSPMFQTALQQGEDAMLQNASATGGLRGGNTQRALMEYRPALLSQHINNQLAQLGGLTSMGQNAAAGVGNAGLATGQSVSGQYTNIGDAQAQSALMQGQNWGNMASGVTSGLMLNQLLQNGGF